jgi:hypothetical protein
MNIAEYQVADSKVTWTQEYWNLETEYEQIKAQFNEARATYAGAAFAHTFKQNPWLAMLDLQLTADSEYCDDGSTCRTISVGLVDAQGTGALVDPKFADDGLLDVDRFEEYLREEWSEEYGQDRIYEIFQPYPHDLTDVRLTVKRADIEDLLAQPTISGYEVFVRLFPQEAKLVGAL